MSTTASIDELLDDYVKAEQAANEPDDTLRSRQLSTPERHRLQAVAQEKRAKIVRAFARKDTEIEDLRMSLTGVRDFLRRGDNEEGGFDELFACERPDGQVIHRDPRGWHMSLADELDETLDESVCYAPFEPNENDADDDEDTG